MSSRCSATLIVLLMSGSPAHAAPPSTGIPEYDKAISKGAAFLRSSLKAHGGVGGGEGSLAAYALLKAGESPKSSIIQKAIARVKSSIDKSGRYVKHGHGVYEAGVDALLLFSAGGADYRTELEAITKYLETEQLSNGCWAYENEKPADGDTSITQYGALGLWAAGKAGVKVPMQMWDSMANWHIKTQFADGGFDYRPLSAGNQTGATLNMAVNGISSLALCKMHLYPDSMKPKSEKKKKKSGTRFGVLEARVEPQQPSDGDTGNSKTPAPASDYRPKTPLGAINAAALRGIGWLATRYVPINPSGFSYYYVYGLERSMALSQLEQLGPHDWYRKTGDVLLKEQSEEGFWQGGGSEGRDLGTSYALLFLVRATKQTVVAQFGGGLLTGGRGLDLDNSELGRDGSLKEKRKISGPLDQLLTDLGNQDPEALFAAQEAIVEKIQLGSREELLGQIDRIRKLITNDNPEIRRTAVWALGRSGDLRDAYLLITALEDTNVDVLVESYNALSYLSRKISGVGIPSNPLADLPEGASQAQIDATVDRWRREALKRWSAWYFRVRPYEERNDLFELRFGAAIGNRAPGAARK